MAEFVRLLSSLRQDVSGLTVAVSILNQYNPVRLNMFDSKSGLLTVNLASSVGCILRKTSQRKHPINGANRADMSQALRNMASICWVGAYSTIP